MSNTNLSNTNNVDSCLLFVDLINFSYYSPGQKQVANTCLNTIFRTDTIFWSPDNQRTLTSRDYQMTLFAVFDNVQWWLAKVETQKYIACATVFIFSIIWILYSKILRHIKHSLNGGFMIWFNIYSTHSFARISENGIKKWRGACTLTCYRIIWAWIRSLGKLRDFARFISQLFCLKTISRVDTTIFVFSDNVGEENSVVDFGAIAFVFWIIENFLKRFIVVFREGWVEKGKDFLLHTILSSIV